MTRSRGEDGAANWTLATLGIAIFLSMNVMVFTMALWTQDFYGSVGAGDTFADVLRGLFRYLCLLFALPVLLLLGGPLLENAWASCRRGVLNADVLLILGVAAAYLYSATSVLRDDGPVYFEVGCMVLILVTLGRWLEATGKLRATAALEGLHRLLPNQARLVENGRERLIDSSTISAGQCLRVLPGERIPCDGLIERNMGMVDEQALTGESQPALKEPGARVFGGSLNLDGDLYVKTTAVPGSGTLARLIELVRQARQTKGHYERLADRVSAWFLPMVIIVALSAAIWHGLAEGLDHGILTGLAVILIACPCALGLATPMAVWNALGQAARLQILFRNGEALEHLAVVRAICFDKTGTLTTGSPVIASFSVANEDDEKHVLAAACALASTSTHAYAGAIRDLAKTGQSGPFSKIDISEARTVPGRGVTGKVAAGDCYLGSPRYLTEQGLHMEANVTDAIGTAQREGESVTCFGSHGTVRGVFTFREELRPEVATALAQLRDLGVSIEILTGDDAARAAALERQLGVTVQADLLPEDKVSALTTARKNYGSVAMVGDGINDAPALAAADAGIALGCGTDVARESAAICLVGNNLTHIPWVICLARRTVRTIRKNLLWAFLYNTFGIGLACTGRLNPVIAALGMVVSSFMVVSNSLRLGGAESGQREGQSAERTARPALCASRSTPQQEPVP